MGRELKRVALDFDWPMGKVWENFLNPHYIECDEDCSGGYSKEYKWLERSTYRDQHLTKEESESPALKKLLPHLPEFKRRQREYDFFGISKEKAREEGLPDDWNTCKVCKGTGIHPDHLEAYENWQKTEPPAGEGYQLWETTSEGSPSSPVFETLEALCEWCEENATTFASFKATKEEWMQMLNDDFVYHREGNVTFL